MKPLPLAAAVALLVLLVYWPVVSLPALGEWYEEQAIDRLSTFRSELLAQYPASFYYRPATRWLDHAWFRLWGNRRCPLPLDRFLFAAVHAACAALLAAWALRATGSAAIGLLSGLMYGLHPALVAGMGYASTRWTVVVPLLFVLIWLACERVLGWEPGWSSRAFFAALAPVLLFLALLAEIGAVAMATLGAWLALRLWQRGDRRHAAWCLAPLAVVPVVYLVLRQFALGNLLAPYAYRDPDTGERLLTYGRNLVFDVSLLLVPLRLPIGVELDAPARRVAAAAGACLLALGLALLQAPVRRFLAERPLPVLALGLFAAMQLNGLWLLLREPVARAGFDRGHVYSLALVSLALLAAGALGSLQGRGRRVALALMAGFVAAEAWAVRANLALWEQAGAILRRHEEQLTPLLRQAPPGTAFSVRGFPPLLSAPYLGWAYAYFYTNSRILATWAGKPVRVYWDQGDAPPPAGFRGYVVENRDGTLRVTREDALAAIEAYLARWSASDAAPPRALEPRAEQLGASGARLERAPDGSLRLLMLDHDPQLGVKLALDPLDWGVLRYEYRCPDVRPGPPVPFAQVYFQPRGGSLDEFRSLRLEVPLARDWHEVRVPLFESPAWTASPGIEALRLDPLERPGLIEIRGLRLENDLEWASWEEARLLAAAP